MSKENKIVKPVSFNPNKPEEAELLKHVKRRNFSGYIKKLIAADIRERQALKEQERPTESVIKEPPLITAAQKLEEMKREKFFPNQ